MTPPGWIIEDYALDALRNSNPNLAETFFDSATTIILANDTGNPVPSGWASQPGRHYTAAGACDASTDGTCWSANRTAPSGTHVMCDLETWTRTPHSEQANPGGALGQFVAESPSGCPTIAAPDQNLAAPGAPMAGAGYQASETQNWQSWLRLGLGKTAARSGADRVHIMSQPFEARWGPNAQGNSQGSEQDFVNYVLLAAAQARACVPGIALSYGLSTNPRYNARDDLLYRDWADVTRLLPDALCWLNLAPRPSMDADAAMAASMLWMIQNGAPTARRSSVLWFDTTRTLTVGPEPDGTAGSLALDDGVDVNFFTDWIGHGGDVLPDGCGSWLFSSDGPTDQYADVTVRFGWQDEAGNRQQLAEIDHVYVYGGQNGTCRPACAYNMDSAVLPGSGNYKFYARVIVNSGAPVSLRYGSIDQPTGLATPVLFAI